MASYDLSVIFRILDKASKPLVDIADKFKGLTPEVYKTQTSLGLLAGVLQGIGDKTKDIGKNMSLKFTAPFVAATVLALKASMDLNSGMANVATLIPGQAERIKQLKKEIQEMAIETGISSEIMAEGMYQIISYMGDTADTSEILAINAKAAAAGLASVKDAVNLTSAVMKGYNTVSAEVAQRTADLSFETVKLGATTFPELAQSMRGSIAWAAQLNLNMEELFAAFATLSGVTGDTAEVGTQMEAVMRGMVKQTDMMTKAIKYLGYDSAKSMLAELGLAGSLKKLNELTKGSEEAMTELFGRAEPLMAVFALTGKMSGIFAEKLEAMKNSTGAADEAFKEQTDTINRAGFKWKQFKFEITDLREELGDRLLPIFEKILDKIRPLLEKISSLSPKTIMAVFAIGAFVAVVGPLLIVIGSMISSIGWLILIGPTIAALLPIVSALAIALAGVSAAIYELVKHWKVLIGGGIKAFFVDFVNWGSRSNPFLKLLIIQIKTLWTFLKMIKESFVGEVFTKWLNNIIKGCDLLYNVFKKIGEFLQNTFIGNLKEAFDFVPDWLKDFISRGLSKIGPILETPALSTPMNTSSAWKETERKAALRLQALNPNSSTDINIKVTADPGTTAVIEKIDKKKGNTTVRTSSVGYVGAY